MSMRSYFCQGKGVSTVRMCGVSPALGTGGIGGAVTISCTAIKATDIVLLSYNTIAGTPGNLEYVITAGASFLITNDQAGNTSTVNWVVISAF